MGWAEVERNLILYADDGRIAGRDHIWVQYAVALTVAIFRRVGIKTNLEKTKSMVFTPSFIWGNWSKEAYKFRATGEGATFRERQRTRVSCAECRVTMAD